MSLPIISLFVRHEHDVVGARQRARQIAARLGFEGQDQTRIATAVSEIARNAFVYAGGGKVEIAVEGRYAPQLLVVRVSDRGPGIRDLDAVLAGRYRSSTGMGLGMLGARRLVDHFEVTSRPGAGVTVTLGKLFPRRAPEIGAAGLAALADTLAREAPQGALEEVRQQNQELLRVLDELRQRQEDLSRLNADLQDTNRGVLALYAELDEKADTLRRADEMKSRFLSNMSHEFRTPLNSMLALSRLLLEDPERPLSSEQKRQVGYIRQAAEDLTELVNDLLDLAKVEAGKIVIRPAEFDVRDLFAALRGMLRPLLLNDQVNLVFEEPEGLPTMHTDEGKVSQILRNLLSNALKFTERGEIRVSARPAGDGPPGALVAFSVADTGIGIDAADQNRIFEEFGQLENPVQRRVRGTGLGLPLVRRLGLSDADPTDVEVHRAREAMLSAGIARLDAFCSEESCPIAVYRLRDAMSDQLASLQAEDEMARTQALQRLAVAGDVRRAVYQAQTDALLTLRDQGVVNDRVHQELQLDLDRASADLRAR